MSLFDAPALKTDRLLCLCGELRGWLQTVTRCHQTLLMSRCVTLDTPTSRVTKATTEVLTITVEKQQRPQTVDKISRLTGWKWSHLEISQASISSLSYVSLGCDWLLTGSLNDGWLCVWSQVHCHQNYIFKQHKLLTSHLVQFKIESLYFWLFLYWTSGYCKF